MLMCLTTDEILAAFTGETPVDKLYYGDTLIYSGAVSPPAFDYLAPSDLTAITFSATRIDLAWTVNSTNRDGHAIERTSVEGGGSGWVEIDRVLGATNTYQNTGLSGANHFWYRVRAYKGDLYSDYSNIALNAVPLIVYSANSVAWYDSTDLTTITKDGGNLVSRWNDKLLSGRDLIQATATYQPLWVLNDGTDCMQALFPLSQPVYVYAVLNFVNNDADTYMRAWSGGTLRMSLEVYGKPKTMRINAGTYLANNNDLQFNTFSIIRAFYNGISSKYQVNNNTATTGNVGANIPNGFTLAAETNFSGKGNFKFKEIILRNVADTSGDETAIYNYLKTKYGL